MSKDKPTPEPPAATLSAMEKLMYIGPTIIKPVPLAHRSVFTGLPVFLEKQSKEIKGVLADCFLPLPQAAAALRELEGTKPAGQVTEKYKRAQNLLRSEK